MSLATRIAQEFNNVRDHLSIPTAYHLLGGNLSVDATVLTTGFGLYLYTGNGGTQSINLGMDLTTQWGDSPNETYGYLIKIKSRSAIGDWTWVNSVRGITKYISSNTTAVEGTDANMFTLSTVTGVTTLNIGTSTRTNTNGVTYVVEVYQTTHRKTGITNQGKAFTEHYNPDTGFTINGYEGSGLSGHDIPHSLGRKLGFIVVKNLNNTYGWISQYRSNNFLYFNQNSAESVSTTDITSIDDNYSTISTSVSTNGSGNQHIMYGWANSYFDESGKLIGNFEIGVYQGTGVAGNKVTTRAKLAYNMIKRLDSVQYWVVLDNQRIDKELYPNVSDTEISYDRINFNQDGFTFSDAQPASNASGGQYLYFGVYDNDNGSGKSKYYKATDTANVQINNGIIPLAHGIDSNGSKNSIVVANETITGVTYTEGKNYLYKTDTGYGVKHYEPRYLKSELIRRFAGEQPDYYDVESNKWYSCDAGVELITNGTFSSGTTTGWTAGANTILSVENGGIKVLQTTTAVGYAYQSFNTIIGTKYTLECSVNIEPASTAAHIYISAIGANQYDICFNNSGLGKKVITFIAQSTTTYITLKNNYTVANSYSIFDNVSVFKTDILPITEINESRNYMNHVVYADADGGVLYVEELPKIEYKNIIKAEKYLGSNAISLSVAFDLTTTPITIKGKMIGAKALIRTSSGIADIYLNDDLKGTELKLDGITNGNQVRVLAIADNKITIETSNSSGTATSYTYTSINGVGE